MTMSSRGGRPPKPRALKVLHGDRKDRINNTEPVPSELEITPPPWLVADGLTVWQQYAPDLIRKKVLTSWDIEAFACLCDSVARRCRATAALAAQGEVIEAEVFNKNGEATGSRLVRNPWVLVLNSSDAQVQRWGARFGMSPAERGQLKVGGSDHVPGEDLLSG